MPPVFERVSPSPTRLWSWAVPKGSAVVPSHRQKKLASSPSKKLLDDDFRPRASKGPVEAVVYRRQRFLDRHRHGHALAGGEPVRLDHDRRADLLDIGPRSGGIREATIGAG